MSAEEQVAYHEARAREEMDRGLVAASFAATRAHLRLASLHMQLVRDLARTEKSPAPLLRM